MIGDGEQARSPRQQVYDRWFLLGEKRNELLTLREVQQYGRDSFDDPDYVSIYGLKPHQWYARDVRILGRTVVECTRDQLAALIGPDIAAVARDAPATSPLVIDLFAGSGNTLYWIKRHTGARRAHGFELDDVVFELARANLRLMDLGIDLRHDCYQHGLQVLGQPSEDLLIVFVAPPPGAMPSVTDQGSTFAAPSHRWPMSSTPPSAFSVAASCCCGADP